MYNSSFEDPDAPTHIITELVVMVPRRNFCNRFFFVMMLMYCIPSTIFVERQCENPCVWEIIVDVWKQINLVPIITNEIDNDVEREAVPMVRTLIVCGDDVGRQAS